MSLGWGVAGVLVGLPVGLGVGDGDAAPVGTVTIALGDGVGVQASAGSRVFTLLCSPGPVGVGLG